MGDEKRFFYYKEDIREVERSAFWNGFFLGFLPGALVMFTLMVILDKFY